MPTLTQLEYLVAVDDARHFGNAAKSCHVSQPTLSMQLHKFEEEYGLTFFDRSKQPILPLPEALPVIAQARAILSEVKKLDHLGKHREKAPSGTFRLAAIPTVAPYLLPLFLESFANKYPKVELSIEEMTTQLIEEALEAEKIDAAILATPLGKTSLTELPLYYEPFYLVVSPGHPLSKKTDVTDSDLDGNDVWLLREGHCFRNQILRICGRRGKAGAFPNVHFESGNLETLVRLVANSTTGQGYTLLPQLALGTVAGAERRKLVRPFASPAPSREISLVYRRSQYKSSILEALVTEIQKMLPKELPREKSREISVVKIG